MAELIAQGGLPLPEERSSDRGAVIGLGTVTPMPVSYTHLTLPTSDLV